MSESNDTNNKPEAKFDPMTGKPIEKKTPEVRFDPMTGKPVKKTNKCSKTKEKLNALKNIFSREGIKSLLNKKWSKSVLIIAAVLIVIIGAFEVFASIPKNKVILSAIKTGRAIKNEKSLDEKVLGISSFTDTFLKGNTVQKIELEDGEAEISLNYIKSAKDKKYFNAAVEKDDDVMADLYVYDDNEKRIFGIPELYDDIFVYNKNKDNEQYKSLVNSLTKVNINFNSMLNSLGDGVGGVAIIGVAASGTEKIAAMTSKVVSQLSPIDLYRQISVEKGDKKDLKIGDDIVKCRGYKVNIPKAVIKQCIDLTSKEIDKTDAIVALVESRKGTLDSNSKKEIRQQTEKILENMKENVKDLDVEVYIYRGKVISCEYETNLDNSSIKNSITFSGKNNPADNVEVSAKVENDNSEAEAVFKINTDYNKKTKDYSKNIEMKIISDTSETGITNKLEFNSETGALTDKMMFTGSLGDISVLKLDADVIGLKKGKSAEIEINKLRLGDEDNELEFKGEYSFKKGKEDLEVKKADIDVNDMSNKEISKAVEKIHTKLDKNMGKIKDGAIKYYYENYYG